MKKKKESFNVEDRRTASPSSQSLDENFGMALKAYVAILLIMNIKTCSVLVRYVQD